MGGEEGSYLEVVEEALGVVLAGAAAHHFASALVAFDTVPSVRCSCYFPRTFVTEVATTLCCGVGVVGGVVGG